MVSYILTVKNGSRYISSCINSVLNQSHYNLELIIVDDGSTDNTIEIIRSFSNDRIKLYPTDGIGRAAALNLAIANSIGEFIAVIDADDLVHLDKTHRQYKILVENNFDILFTNYEVFTLDNEVTLDKPFSNTLTYEEVLSNKLFIRNPFLHSSMMIRRSCLVDVCHYDQSLKRLVDYDLYFRLKNNNVKFYVLPEVLSFKRYHSEQQFERNKRLSYLISIFLLQSKYIFSDRKFHYVPFVFLKLIYSLLPSSIRKFINNNL